MKLNKKLAKHFIDFEDILAELSPDDRQDVEVISQYYSLLVDLEDLRKKLKLTQAELAKRSLVPRTTISKIESGQRNVTIGTLTKLARGMDKELKISFV